VNGPPVAEPIGLELSRTAKLVSRAFDDALAAAGGSLPVWLVLVTVKAQSATPQRRLAEAAGIEGATLTHHLNRLEAAGLVTRRRDPDNRRVQHVALTDDGQAAFFRLLEVVTTFDRRLRAGFDEHELATLRALLGRLRENADGSAS
jgi:MarR family transcriptional regulator for hemolysin